MLHHASRHFKKGYNKYHWHKFRVGGKNTFDCETMPQQNVFHAAMYTNSAIHLWARNPPIAANFTTTIFQDLKFIYANTFVKVILCEHILLDWISHTIYSWTKFPIQYIHGPNFQYNIFLGSVQRPGTPTAHLLGRFQTKTKRGREAHRNFLNLS